MNIRDLDSSRRGFLAAVGTTLFASGSRAQAAPPAAALHGLIPAGDILLDPGIVHLQTGTLGLTPRPVLDATIAAVRKIERDPLIAAYGPGKERLDGVRREAAALVGCTMAELVLTGSTTAGMNTVAEGLSLSAGDRVLTTDQEHHGGSLCWDWLARRTGIHVDRVPIPPGEIDATAIVDRFAKAITPATKVMSFSHILYSTGLRMPAAELCALGRKQGCIAVIDGAQAVGAIPVDVKAIGCHAYAGSGHKWLLGPKGTGLLYLSAELGNVDAMVLQSGRQVNSDATGIANIAGLYGLQAAIGYVQAVGVERIERHNLMLCDQLRAGIAGIRGLHFAAPGGGPLASQMVTFSLDGVDIPKLRAKLKDRRIHVRGVDQNGYTGVRASPHLYNDSTDIEALVAALKQELA